MQRSQLGNWLERTIEDALKKVFNYQTGQYYKDGQDADSTWYKIRMDLLKAPMHLYPQSGVTGNLTKILWALEAKNYKSGTDK